MDFLSSTILNSTTPSKGLKGRTPKKTPMGDRFIPNRAAMDLDRSHYILTQKENPLAQSERILKFSEKAPQTGRVIFEAAIQAPRPTKKAREIQQVPYRSLDAPNILDDYYVNPVDCGATGELAVALGQSVFVTSAKSTGSVDELVNFALEGSNDFATSVNWDGAGSYLAIGTNNAEVQIWDREHGKKIRTMKGHAARVGALSWNGALLSSGCRDGSIFNHDVRVAKHHVGSLSAHTQEVCGLKWSPDGSQLASGGNDNIVNIWDAGKTTPKFSMTEHQAAVKALAWCPWQSSLLATGGGTADRHIRFWNTSNGQCVNAVDTKSQVCSLVWSKDYKELVSSHGYSENQLIVWKYPTMEKVTELTGHTARVLHLALTPDGETVISAAADETIRFWRCFESTKKTKSSPMEYGSSSFTAGLNIR